MPSPVDPASEDRGASPVAPVQRFLASARSQGLLYGAGAVAAFGLMALGLTVGQRQHVAPDKPDTGSSVIEQVTASPPPPPPEPVRQEPVRQQVVTTPPPPATLVVQSQQPVVTPHYVHMPADSGETNFGVAPPRKTNDDGEVSHVAAAGGHSVGAGKDTTKVAFKAATLAGGKAGPAMRMTYVMRPQLIPCALDTAMDSSLAGAIQCHTTQDVLSQDHVLLMPAGTSVVGTYKADVKTGQNRLFAFAGSAITREGIPVPLDSGVADGLGHTGVSGDVDNHYPERFGAALLLTAADAAVSIAQSALSSGNSQTLNIGGNISGGSGIAAIAQEILRSQINIPPTITVPPGTIISIVVDHPIYFGDAIKVSAIR